MKKLRIGDSVNFKNGKTGIVEDYDDKYYYIKDTNGYVSKVKKVNDELKKIGIENFENKIKNQNLLEDVTNYLKNNYKNYKLKSEKTSSGFTIDMDYYSEQEYSSDSGIKSNIENSKLAKNIQSYLRTNYPQNRWNIYAGTIDNSDQWENYGCSFYITIYCEYKKTTGYAGDDEREERIYKINKDYVDQRRLLNKIKNYLEEIFKDNDEDYYFVKPFVKKGVSYYDGDDTDYDFTAVKVGAPANILDELEKEFNLKEM